LSGGEIPVFKKSNVGGAKGGPHKKNRAGKKLRDRREGVI